MEQPQQLHLHGMAMTWNVKNGFGKMDPDRRGPNRRVLVEPPRGLGGTNEELDAFQRRLDRRLRDNTSSVVAIPLAKVHEVTIDPTDMEYDEAITAIDAEKKRLLSEANFPVDGLRFDSEGLVTMDGLPFDQCSQAQKIRVGAAMAMAMNPNLRVILITDALLLDDESKRLVNEMAREKGFQVWYEVVDNPADATLVLEDGAAVTAEPSDLPEAVA